MIRELLWVGVAYLLGSLPTALIAVRLSTGGDIRRQGASFFNMGAIYALQNQYEKALEFYTKSQKIRQQM